jgi:N,N'-diacetylchitobiose transport system permease protein
MSASDIGAADDLIASELGPAPGRSGRRRTLRSPRGHRSLPYLLIVPSLAVLFGIFGYPAVYLVRISFQQFDLPQLFGSEPTKWIGFDNYVEFITGDNFIPIVIRTLAFTTACVVLTIGLGLLIALLMQRSARQDPAADR